MTEVVLIDTDVFSYIWQGRPEAEPFAPLVEGRIAARLLHDRSRGVLRRLQDLQEAVG